jgi:hypothetical protein
MKVLIKITKEVLEESMYCSTNCFLDEQAFIAKEGALFNCAISNAVGQLLPGALTFNNRIVLCESYDDLECGNYLCEIPIPKKADTFILAFDGLDPLSRTNMHPISFEIDIPDSVINRIGLDEVNEILSKSLTLERV